MPELREQLRRYVDDVVAPVALSELRVESSGVDTDLETDLAPVPRPPAPRRGHRGRWLGVAAAVVCLGLLTALLVGHRTRSSDQVAVGPTATSSAGQADWSWVDQPPGRATPPEMAAPVVPAGWQTLDYLDVRFSVPGDWTVALSRTCHQAAPGVVFVPGLQDGAQCSPVPSLPTSAVTFDSIKGALRGGTPATIGTLHVTRYGIAACDTCAAPMYLLPNGYVLTVSGPDAARVLATFTDSGAQRLLQRGPLASTPGWHRVTYQSLSILAPPSWPTRDLGVPPTTLVGPNGITSSGGYLNPGACIGNLFPPDPQAYVSIGNSSVSPGCAMSEAQLLSPGQGVWIRPAGGGVDRPDDRPVARGQINGLAVTAVETPDSPSLDLLVTTPGGTTVRLSLSSGLDSSVARAILHSLKPTA